MNQNGISTELDYPFVQQQQTRFLPCDKNKIKPVSYQSGTLVTIQANNPYEMKQALSKQPIVASIASGSLAFQLYKSGVMSNCHGDTDINHYVLLVGYNDLENSWTFKNSWGQTWGMQGYAKITIEQGNGLCGINMDVSHPKL
uniref:Catepsin 90 n=1 Tax=Philasterides dicentrarchi TaxID=282688 RepID=A0A481SB70_9CILI|nr:catepsin 90 [Philasterides dicentrarchi]